MKTLKLLTIIMVLFFTSTLKSQVSVNVSIGSPPMWGPYGYTEVRYYYLPDVEAYYDIETAMFIYYYGGGWIYRTYLPTRYRYYDLYSGYKVVITDYHGAQPYIHFKNHKVKYFKGYKGGGPQKTIGNNPGKGNHKNGGPGNNAPQKNSHQNNTKSGGNRNDKGSYGNENKGGGNDKGSYNNENKGGRNKNDNGGSNGGNKNTSKGQGGHGGGKGKPK